MAFWRRKVTDPVCGMEIDRDKAAASYEYQGKTYYFCALACKSKFEQHPEEYVGREQEQHQSHGHGCC